ncbi:MAG TPA: DinB family protein, partial [Candidatus Nanopelagicales bacterium]
REAVLWKLEGLAEHDQRRPMVPTGTNLLGLVKHLAFVEAGYFGTAFGRPVPATLVWDEAEDADPTADLWATAEESPAELARRYREVAAASDALIEALPLEAPASVPWWDVAHREVTLRLLLVHVIAETNRHAGHADILRELIDGAVGLRATNPNVPDRDEAWWAEHRARLEEIAGRAGASG